MEAKDINQHSSLFHQGYMHGLMGIDPQNEEVEDYVNGWLGGSEDKERGVEVQEYQGPVASFAFTKGHKFTIPKGTMIFSTRPNQTKKIARKTITVTAHDVYQGVPAYRTWDHDGGFERPTCAKIVWSGAGGYWNEAPLSQVVPVE